MMGILGKQIQYVFVVSPFGHQIVQHQDPAFVPEPTGQILHGRQSFGHAHFVIIAQSLQERLHGPITIMETFRHRTKIPMRFIQQFRHKDGLPTARGTHHQDVRRGTKDD